ncbi:hypothetical protein [Aquisphaera giovannonii]|uniref:hypothetical protein n=1 Tax=Aquisphaera giovannonii TaxID=406548 RepID=UPI0011DFF87F|nr:hypothetical protein [Aquisphaera giovannonii]
MSRCSERYPGSWLEWYAWCLRTGRGDRRAAARLVEAQLDAGRTPTSDDLHQVSILLLLEGKPEVARRLLGPEFEKGRNTMDGVFLALACDQEGDGEARDAALKAVAEDPKASGPKTAKIMGVLFQWLSHGDQSPLDIRAIEELSRGADPSRSVNTAACLGLFLDRHGKPEDARPYLEQADSDVAVPWIRFLAREALRSRGAKLKPLRG